MTTSLVTGGAGFIGSHLCEALLARGRDVICLDNLFTGSKRNIDHLRDNPRFEFIRHDIVNPILLEADEIYNLACPASPVHYQYNPVKTIKTNIIGTINMLGIAKRVGARILQASTSEIYGDPLIHPQKEEYWGNVNPIGLRSCYDEGKRAAETLMFDYHRQNKVDIRVVRIFNTYGPRMALDDGRVISNFTVQALKGQPLLVYGKGQQTRSFCYIDDLVDGMILVMEKEGLHEPINLGMPEEHTILEIAQQVIVATGSRSTIIHAPLPSDDPARRKPDISRAKALLGFNPTITLQQGVQRTADYFKALLAADA